MFRLDYLSHPLGICVRDFFFIFRLCWLCACVCACDLNSLQSPIDRFMSSESSVRAFFFFCFCCTNDCRLVENSSFADFLFEQSLFGRVFVIRVFIRFGLRKWAFSVSSLIRTSLICVYFISFSSFSRFTRRRLSCARSLFLVMFAIFKLQRSKHLYFIKCHLRERQYQMLFWFHRENNCRSIFLVLLFPLLILANRCLNEKWLKRFPIEWKKSATTKAKLKHSIIATCTHTHTHIQCWYYLISFYWNRTNSFFCSARRFYFLVWPSIFLLWFAVETSSTSAQRSCHWMQWIWSKRT